MNLLALMVVCNLAAHANFNTLQGWDHIIVGNTEHGIPQFPMNGYWYHEGEEPNGRQPFPAFQVTSSANWAGYDAQWRIAEEKLWLDRIEGRIAGEDVSNRQIIDRRFPMHATWFTGSIFTPLGDLDEENGTFEYVIEFQIDAGNVTNTEIHDSLQIPLTWNGLEAEPATPSDE